MTTAAAMLDTSRHRPPVDTQLLGDTIDVLIEASRTGRQCADACRQESGSRLSRCMALNHDVAAMTSATAELLIRLADPDSVRASLVAGRAVLRACAVECRTHAAHLPACARCAEVCERAEDLCVRMEAATAHLVIVDGRVATAPVPADDVPTDALDHLDVTESVDGEPPIHLSAGGDIGDGAD
jgi:hypothetical protein